MTQNDFLTIKKVDTNKIELMKKLVSEILAVTMDIKNKFPEHYKHLDENPLFFSFNNKKPSYNDYVQYLNTLKEQLKKRESSIIF